MPDVSAAGTPIEFWYDFASPYAYMAAMRIEATIGDRPLRLVWKPFLLGPIFKRRAANPSPFQQPAPDEERYRRRDVERLCAAYKLPLSWPSTYPRGSLVAARVALLASDGDWCSDVTRAIYHASFVEDRDIADATVVRDIVTSLGRDGERIVAAATAPEVKTRLAAQVDEAIGRGLFGAPSFVIKGELFWGNDRLEQALDWQGESNVGLR